MHIKGFPVEKKKQTTILNEAAAKIKIKLWKLTLGKLFFAHKRSFTAIKKRLLWQTSFYSDMSQ